LFAFIEEEAQIGKPTIFGRVDQNESHKRIRPGALAIGAAS
jgi:hypothetical protein